MFKTKHSRGGEGREGGQGGRDARTSLITHTFLSGDHQTPQLGGGGASFAQSGLSPGVQKSPTP